ECLVRFSRVKSDHAVFRIVVLVEIVLFAAGAYIFCVVRDGDRVNGRWPEHDRKVHVLVTKAGAFGCPTIGDGNAGRLRNRSVYSIVRKVILRFYAPNRTLDRDRRWVQSS